jgi:hypothetical protein
MAVAVVDNWNTLEILLASAPVNVEALCTVIARIFGVGTEEVGLLRVYGFSLEFLFPLALKSAGRIPLTTSAIAVRTASSKTPEIFNDFAAVDHNAVFESVPLGRATSRTADSKKIQKMIAAPILDAARKSIGVIEVSRKGCTRDDAGRDFTDSDLQKLDRIAHKLSVILEE